MSSRVTIYPFVSVVYGYSGAFRHGNHSIYFVLVFPNVMPCHLLSSRDHSGPGNTLPKGVITC
jgi:hypothetical protein